MKPCRWPVADLLPHAPPMILIDRVLSWAEGRLLAEVTVRPEAPFYDSARRGIAAHVAIEWMAQSCGAYVGAEALESGGAVRLGLLLGTRDFRAARPWFADGERLEVSVALVYRDGEMGVFDCAVAPPAAEPAATAQLTVYQPADASALLGQGRAPS